MSEAVARKDSKEPTLTPVPDLDEGLESTAKKTRAVSKRPTSPKKKSRPRKKTKVGKPKLPVSRARREVGAVLLATVGLLTLLSLLSFNAQDASLNTQSDQPVQNWIGPVGAYTADLVLQFLGFGAYALSIGTIFASVRTFMGHRTLPGRRELLGLALVAIFVGALSHMAWGQDLRDFPPGGVPGALLAGVLVTYFASIGATIIAVAGFLISLSLAVDGILRGLGGRGISVAKEALRRLDAYSIYLKESAQARREHKAELLAEKESARWSMDTGAQVECEEKAEERRENARSKGRERGRKKAEKELESAKKKALRDRELSMIDISEVIDLQDEETFVPGALPDIVSQRKEEVEDAEPTLAALPEYRPDRERASEVSALEPPPRVKAPAVVADLPPKRVVRNKKESLEPQILDMRETVDEQDIDRAAEELDESRSYQLPPVSLLDFEATDREPIDPEQLKENAQKLSQTLKHYNIDGNVREIRTGPVVTMYEFVPAPGIKLSKIAGLADDIAMSMEAMRVRIVAPIPGKGAVGIEIPNETREMVYFKEIMTSRKIKGNNSKLTMALGKDIEGRPYAADLAKMPHLLVAGATGAGKSVSVNSMIMSILFNATPDEVRLIMVDPKMLELSMYDGIPHLLLPVVTDPQKATLALRWAVQEMERRYRAMSEVGVRNLAGYNKKVDEAKGQLSLPGLKEGDDERVYERMPFLVVIVDELADLMMVASRDVESCIMRLAQMARAAGIHLILATQRPSVDVLTGVIKANFPTRIAFQVASRHDSRTILDQNGAENLLGKGDMLFQGAGVAGINRVHGAFVSDEEIERTVAFLKEQGEPQYDESILQVSAEDEGDGSGGDVKEEVDSLYDEAIAVVTKAGQASVSMVQRRLRIGYNRAARIVEQMEIDGIVGPADGAKPRKVLAPPPPEV